MLLAAIAGRIWAGRYGVSVSERPRLAGRLALAILIIAAAVGLSSYF
jgi:hypothetical protein